MEINHSPDTSKTGNEIIFCIKCPKARFPSPNEQCYRFGGLICSIDEINVGKYDKCRFGFNLNTIKNK